MIVAGGLIPPALFPAIFEMEKYDQNEEYKADWDRPFWIQEASYRQYVHAAHELAKQARIIMQGASFEQIDQVDELAKEFANKMADITLSGGEITDEVARRYSEEFFKRVQKIMHPVGGQS
jgi:hypothetical protein